MFLTKKVHSKTDEKIIQLRQKIIKVAIVILLCMFACVIAFTSLIMDIYNNKEADNNISAILTAVIMTDGNINIPSTVSYFVVQDDTITQSMTLNNTHKLDQEKALQLYKQVDKKDGDKGTIQHYRYGVRIFNNSTYAAFINIEQYQETKNLATGILLVILLVSFAILSIVTSICSNFIIQPFIESTEYQKQFITDASHDLKTPLAVIVANADVIAISGGDTKWTKNIKKEAKKMSELIDDMLTLSKLDSFTNNQTPIQLNISDMLNEMISEFDPMWKERKIKVDNRVNANLTVTGSQQQVNRLFRTIMQNATKYTTEGGTFELVAKRIKNRIMVSMYNTAQLDPNMDYNKMFERFYRSDSSRNSKTGGHGIGLAIAKKICELEGYQIRAEKQREGIAFIITI